MKRLLLVSSLIGLFAVTGMAQQKTSENHMTSTEMAHHKHHEKREKHEKHAKKWLKMHKHMHMKMRKMTKKEENHDK
ncbi:MAG: hypothetical protein ACYCOO_07980 [Chitinophagaceae bacterium]